MTLTPRRVTDGLRQLEYNNEQDLDAVRQYHSN